MADTLRPLTVNEISAAILMGRNALLTQLDPKGRDLAKQCGYATGEVTAETYRQIYDRQGIAARVVGVYPDESWSCDPIVYETEDGENTPFEEAWDTLVDEQQVWHYLHRVDKLSGIGSFGVLLLGFDDIGKGGDLSQPVAGAEAWLLGKDLTPPNRKLLFLRALDQTLVDVASTETDVSSPRLGQPLTYNVMLSDPRLDSTGGTTGPQKSAVIKTVVHWTRVLHVADNRMASEVYGVPRMQQVLDDLYDVRKTSAGAAEMFWKGAFPGYSFETLPQLASQGRVTIDAASLQEQFLLYQEQLQRYLALDGMTAKSLAPQVADPTNQLIAQYTKVCTTIGVPLRIFLGSEAGHLASTQDAGTWNRRLGRRHTGYLTPFVIRPFVLRMCACGVIPPPAKRKFVVGWNDLNSLSDAEKADVALKRAQAILQYVSGGCETVMPLRPFLTRIMGFGGPESDAIIAEAEGSGNDFTGDVWKQPEPALTQGGGRQGNANTGKNGRPAQKTPKG